MLPLLLLKAEMHRCLLAAEQRSPLPPRCTPSPLLSAALVALLGAAVYWRRRRRRKVQGPGAPGAVEVDSLLTGSQLSRDPVMSYIQRTIRESKARPLGSPTAVLAVLHRKLASLASLAGVARAAASLPPAKH